VEARTDSNINNNEQTFEAIMAEIGQQTEPPTTSNFGAACYFAVGMSIGHRHVSASPTHPLCYVILSPKSNFALVLSFAGPTHFADLARRRLAHCRVLPAVVCHHTRV